MKNKKSKYHKSFLKWPGSKFRVIDKVVNALPQSHRLIEAFVGGANVFLNTEFDDYLLADINADLIHVYNTLKTHGYAFIDECEELFHPQNNCERVYYDLRDEFNNSDFTTRKAAIFCYINKCSYNGLIRYNRSHRLNTPFGHYKSIYFPRAEMEFFLAKAKKAKFICAPFEESLKHLRKFSTVYLDPPFCDQDSKTKCFTAYSGHGFNLNDQDGLSKLAQKLASRGIFVVLSNHDTEFTRRLYKGATFESFSVRRSISCDGANRKKAKELLASWV